MPVTLLDNERPFAAREVPALDPPGPDKAFEAWRRRDYLRLVAHCVAVDGGSAVRASTLPAGPGWALALRGMPLFVMIDSAHAQLVLECPVVRLPLRRRTAALRMALELSGSECISSRFCLREDLLLLRFVSRLAAISPALLRHAMREMARLAERYVEQFCASLGARPLASEEARTGGLVWDVLGHSRSLLTLPAAPARRSVPPPPLPTLRPPATPPELGRQFEGGSAATRPTEPAMTAPFDDTLPAILAPTLADAPAAAPSVARAAAVPPSRKATPMDAPSAHTTRFRSVPPPPMPSIGSDGQPLMPPQRSPSSLPPRLTPIAEPAPPLARLAPVAEPAPPSDSLPPVLAPPDYERVPAPAKVPTIPPVLAPPPTATPGRLRDLRQRRDTQPAFAAVSGYGQNPPKTSRGTLPEIDLDAIARRSPSSRVPVREGDAADRLCDLLHHSQALATALSFDERPATMMLLVRATVYRAIYEFGDAVPDAVAHLYRATTMATREIWPSSPQAWQRNTVRIPMAEPALMVMERIITVRAQVPKEKALAVDPLTSATQAREHLARYAEEIDASPPDPALRHFLVLGALTELLVRARLPAQTGQRLRDIVARALRDGAKSATIDLMTTALSRIIAG